MATVTDWDDRETAYNYDDAGRLETASLPNGVAAAYEYDSVGRLLNLENANGEGTISEYAYTLDAVGNRTQVVDTNGTTVVGYDAGYQVTDVIYPNDDEQSFSYDPMGNRLSMSLTGESTVTYEYDAADQLNEAGSLSYGNDDNGNQSNRGSDTFEWDPRNRLVETDIDSVEGT